MRLIYYLFLCLILTECLPAQKLLSIRDSLELNIELIGPEQGLSQGQINGIAEDQEGYLWIATKDGLNRYDGHSFRVFRNDPDNPYSISENFITAVYVDSRNLLWVGTNSSGLELFDRKHERFIHISNDKAIQSNEQVHNVSRIIEDFSGQIIIHDLTGSKIQVISSKNIDNTLSYLPQTKLLELYP
ncbi:MAG: two-component regulator propeller domain-containing protein, partial [Thiofilum sp.]